MNAYLRCPAAYRFEYLDGVAAQGSDASLLGSVCHEFFEAYDNHLARIQKAQDVGAAREIMERVFFGHERPVPPALYEDYLAICRSFTEKHRLDLGSFVGAEVEIALTRELLACPWDAPDAWFRARLDRLDKPWDRLVVTDYKTGWGGDADPFQFLTYAAVVWLWNETNPVRPDTGAVAGIDVVVEYARSNKRIPRRFGPEEIQTGIRLLKGYTARLEAETAWAPTPGEACRSCAFAALCPARARNLVDLNDPETAARVAGESMLLRAQATAREDALRGWVRDRGPVAVGKAAYVFGTRERFHISDPVEFMAVVTAHGHDAELVYNGGTQALRRLCQRDPVLAEAVAPYVDVDVSEFFGVRKVAS